VGETATADLSGRVALVTGATSGIGEAAAVALAAAGARVMVAGRDAGRGAAVVERIRAAGGEAALHLADLHSSAAIDALVSATVDTFGRLDIAFNNAGIFDRSREFHTYDDALWDDMIAVNLSAVFRCMRAEIAVMLAGGGGSIVNCASTVSHRASERASPAYVAAKHGVLGLTRQAALEYVNRGIRVNAVSPGPTLTPVAAPLVAEGPGAVQTALGGLNPTGRFVPADEVGRVVVFLCSDAASMINGHDIPLDGGQLARL
jgi:NAD(P)-dependent dehydrogenase (short-subunit alcohol dehydrogenase family)